MANGDDETGGRAAVTGQRSGHGYDVGLHAQDELGTFDVGLAVEGVPGAGESLGLFVQAPRVGRLRVAFAVTPDGVTRLAALERKDDDGVPLPTAGLVAIDEGKTLRLEAQVKRYEDANARLETERDEHVTARDEARDRAAALSEERLALKAKLKDERDSHANSLTQTEFALSQVRNELAIEKEQRLTALAERELARQELDSSRQEVQGAAEAEQLRVKVQSLTAEVLAEQEKTGRVEQELEAARLQVADAGKTADSARDELAAQTAKARAELAAARADSTTKEQTARTDRAQLEAKLSAAATAAGQAEEVAAGQASALGAQVTALEAQLTAAQSAATRARTADEEALKNEAALMEAKLEAAQADAAQQLHEREITLEGEAARLKAELDERDAKLAGFAAEVEAFKTVREAAASLTSERDEARAVARQLQASGAKVAVERDEARNVARTLHQKMAAGGTEAEGARSEVKEMRDTLSAERRIASQLVTDKQRLQMQIDSLSRQLDTERSGRARLATERDELREKLSLSPMSKDFSREETRPYELGTIKSTQPETPAVPLPPEWGEEATDPGNRPEPLRRTVKTDPMGGVMPLMPPKKGK